MAKGAGKYGERNWEKGQDTSRSYESALRHLYMWQIDDSEDHLSAAVFNIFSIVHVQEMIKRGLLSEDLDTFTRYIPKPEPETVRYTSESIVDTVWRIVSSEEFKQELDRLGLVYNFELHQTEKAKDLAELQKLAAFAPKAEEPNTEWTKIDLKSKTSTEEMIAELERRDYVIRPRMVSDIENVATTVAKKDADDLERILAGHIMCAECHSRRVITWSNAINHGIRCQDCGYMYKREKPSYTYMGRYNEMKD
jgi:hypothetical protein